VYFEILTISGGLHMSVYRLLVLTSVFLAICVGRTVAGGWDDPQRLDGLGNVVEKICKTVTEAKGSSTTAQIEGTVKAALPGLLKKFLNIDASATGKIGNETYEGLSREATATAMESSLQCRERLFSKMLDKLSQNDMPSNVTLSGTITSGRDTIISGPVHFGLDEEKTGEAVKEAMQPYREQLSQFNVRVDQVIAMISSNKGVPISLLQFTIRRVYGDKINTQDVPKVLALVDAMAEELLAAREELRRLKAAAQAQIALSECDYARFNSTLKSLDYNSTMSSLDYNSTLKSLAYNSTRKSVDYHSPLKSLDYNEAYRDIFGQEPTEIDRAYDKVLREKLEQWSRESELADQANTRKATLDPATGIVDSIEAINRSYLGVMMHPNSNCSVVRPEEVQILIQQWKTITDMTASLSNDINDMAMTAVRNLR
jgi:hypothetical protein